MDRSLVDTSTTGKRVSFERPLIHSRARRAWITCQLKFDGTLDVYFVSPSSLGTPSGAHNLRPLSLAGASCYLDFTYETDI